MHDEKIMGEIMKLLLLQNLLGKKILVFRKFCSNSAAIVGEWKIPTKTYCTQSLIEPKLVHVKNEAILWVVMWWTNIW